MNAKTTKSVLKTVFMATWTNNAVGIYSCLHNQQTGELFDLRKGGLSRRTLDPCHVKIINKGKTLAAACCQDGKVIYCNVTKDVNS